MDWAIDSGWTEPRWLDLISTAISFYRTMASDAMVNDKLHPTIRKYFLKQLDRTYEWHAKLELDKLFTKLLKKFDHHFDLEHSRNTINTAWSLLILDIVYYQVESGFTCAYRWRGINCHLLSNFCYFLRSFFARSEANGIRFQVIFQDTGTLTNGYEAIVPSSVCPKFSNKYSVWELFLCFALTNCYAFVRHRSVPTTPLIGQNATLAHLLIVDKE